MDDRALVRLHEAGIRGLRVNLHIKAAGALADCPDLAARIHDMGWHLQIFMDVSTLDPDVMGLLERLPVPLVFDHMGFMNTGKGVDNPGFQLAQGPDRRTGGHGSSFPGPIIWVRTPVLTTRTWCRSPGR